MSSTLRTAALVAESTFRTVLPGERGYYLPEEQVPLSQRYSGKAYESDFCGVSSSHGANDKAKTMSFVGRGTGEYVCETRYKYIGPGGGEFSMEDPHEKKLPPARPCCCSWVPLLIVATLGMLAFGWLFLPEEQWNFPSRSFRASRGNRSNSSNSSSEMEEAEPIANTLSMRMQVVNVNWEQLRQRSQEQLLTKFFEEVKEGIALTVGTCSNVTINPDNVTVWLESGSATLHATIHPPERADLGVLRSRIASNADKVAEGVLASLEMMHKEDINEFKTGSLSVVGVEVVVATDLPPKASTTMAPPVQNTTSKAAGDSNMSAGDDKASTTMAPLEKNTTPKAAGASNKSADDDKASTTMAPPEQTTTSNASAASNKSADDDKASDTKVSTTTPPAPPPVHATTSQAAASSKESTDDDKTSDKKASTTMAPQLQNTTSNAAGAAEKSADDDKTSDKKASTTMAPPEQTTTSNASAASNKSADDDKASDKKASTTTPPAPPPVHATTSQAAASSKESADDDKTSDKKESTTQAPRTTSSKAAGASKTSADEDEASTTMAPQAQTTTSEAAGASKGSAHDDKDTKATV